MSETRTETRWTVTYLRHANGPRRQTTRLQAKDTVRQWLETLDATPGAQILEITEHTAAIIETDIAWDDLPAEGEPTPAPPTCLDSRFYRLADRGPAVLPTGDAVRALRKRIEDQCRDPRSALYRVDPDALGLQEVMILRHDRPVPRENFAA
jgi:hypothetical protein